MSPLRLFLLLPSLLSSALAAQVANERYTIEPVADDAVRVVTRDAGAWVFRGTRLPVATVIENLEDLSIDEVMKQFDVTREQVAAVLDYVAQSLRAAAVPAGARPL